MSIKRFVALRACHVPIVIRPLGVMTLRVFHREPRIFLATNQRNIRGNKMPSVLQNWVTNLSYMQQSVLIASIRAPDGLPKDHPVKVIMRWYRRCVLIRAFDNKVAKDPYELGGGSFTGPFTDSHAAEMKIKYFDEVRGVYLRHVDEMPHHFQLHMMHAAQIIGYKHYDPIIAEWWKIFYEMIVNDAHLFPETEKDMSIRLGDNEAAWRAREGVTAK